MDNLERRIINGGIKQKDVEICNIDYLNAIGYQLKNCERIITRDIYRMVVYRSNTDTIYYTRCSKKVGEEVVYAGKLKYEYTYKNDNWLLKFGSETSEIYHGLDDDNKHIGWHHTASTYLGGSQNYKVNITDKIRNALKIMEKLYNAIYGDTEVKETQDIIDNIIAIRKKIRLKEPKAIEKYNNARDTLIRYMNENDIKLMNIRSIINSGNIQSTVKIDTPCIQTYLYSLYASYIIKLFNLEDSAALSCAIIFKTRNALHYVFVVAHNEDFNNRINVFICKHTGMANERLDDKTMAELFDKDSIDIIRKYEISAVPNEYKLMVLKILTVYYKEFLSMNVSLYGFDNVGDVKYINEI